MFTLNDINSELQKYNKYMNSDLDRFADVIYKDDYYMDAQIKDNDLNSNIYKIYINNKMSSYPIQYQKSVLWHEFTHLYDHNKYLNESHEFTNNILKSYSEAHAESIKYRYLLHLSRTQPLMNYNVNVLTSEGSMSYQKASGSLMNQSVYYMNQFLITHNPYDFDNALNFAFYFYGAVSLLPKRSLILNKVLETYPKKFNYDIVNIGKAVFKKDVYKVIDIYINVKSEAVKFSCS